MPPLTLQQATDLPQANYLNPGDLQLLPSALVEAATDSCVITNPTSLHPIPYTTSLATCIAIMVENKHTGTMLLTHTSMEFIATLQKMMKVARRSKNDPLEIHLIGGCHDIDGKYKAEEYREQSHLLMQNMLDTINAEPNVEIKTWDIGEKPHPTSVAFVKNSSGVTQLVRGSVDYSSLAEMEYAAATGFQDPHKITKSHSGHAYPFPDNEFIPTANEPFQVTWDGRKPEFQDPNRKLLDAAASRGGFFSR